MIFFHGTEVWGKVLLKVLFFAKKIYQISNLKKIFFSIFSKKFISEKIWIFFQFWSNFFEKNLWETFFFINRHVKHTFVHYEYVEVPLGLAEHISGQDFLHRPLPADIIWLEFGSFSNFLRKKFGFIQKMADLANLAGRLADVANCIWTGLKLFVKKNLKSRVISKTRWDNTVFVSGRFPYNQRNPQINGAIL